jgi:hypothetical protein
MQLIMINGQPWVLNTDGKIQLTCGEPNPKYDSGPTPEQSESSVDIA